MGALTVFFLAIIRSPVCSRAAKAIKNQHSHMDQTTPWQFRAVNVISDTFCNFNVFRNVISLHYNDFRITHPKNKLFLPSGLADGLGNG